MRHATSKSKRSLQCWVALDRGVIPWISYAINLIDPQTVEAAGTIETQQRVVSRGKDIRRVGSKREQGVDVKEPPTAQLLCSHAPKGEPIVLCSQQLIEPLSLRVDRRDNFINRCV